MGPLLVRLLAALAGLGLLVVPVVTAQPGAPPPRAFATTIDPTTFDSDRGMAGIALITGRMSWSSEAAGLYVFEGTRSWHAVQTTRVEVYNQTAIDAAQQARRLPRGPVSTVFAEASMSADTGSSLALMTETVGIAYTCNAPFVLGLPMRLPADTFEDPTPVLAHPHLATSGADQTCTLRQASTTSDTFVQLLDNRSAITVTPTDGDPQTFRGQQWAFKIFGTPDYETVAEGLITPFHGPARATVTPYDGRDLANRFTAEPLSRMFRLLAGDGGPDDGEGQDEDNVLPGILTDLGPILNGVIIGDVTTAVVVEGEPFGQGGYSFVRFETADLNANATNGLNVTGQSRLVMSGGSVHTARPLIAFGPLQVPILSVLIWVVAAAAVVGTFGLRPFVRPDQVRSLGLMRIVGFLFHMAALVLAFVLFDREFAALLGTSLLSLVFGGSGSGVALVAVAVLQLLAFALAAVFFGLPLRFITNAALRLGGLKGASGFGKGVGNLAIWGIGALYLRVILGGFIAMVFSIFSGAGG